MIEQISSHLLQSSPPRALTQKVPRFQWCVRSSPHNACNLFSNLSRPHRFVNSVSKRLYPCQWTVAIVGVEIAIDVRLKKDKADGPCQHVHSVCLLYRLWRQPSLDYHTDLRRLIFAVRSSARRPVAFARVQELRSRVHRESSSSCPAIPVFISFSCTCEIRRSTARRILTNLSKTHPFNPLSSRRHCHSC